MSNNRSRVTEGDGQSNTEESSEMIRQEIKQLSDSNLQQRPVTLVDEEIKDKNIQLNINSTFHQKDQVQAILCSSHLSSDFSPLISIPSSSELSGFNQYDAKPKEHVIVPWGWKRILSSDIVVYLR